MDQHFPIGYSSSKKNNIYCYILEGTLKVSGKPKGQSHTQTRSKDVYCLVATTSKCVPAIHGVYSYSVTRTACSEVPEVLLYIDLATYRVVASVSVVIAQLSHFILRTLTHWCGYMGKW